MPVAVRPPVIDPNIAISNALSQTEQTQEIFFLAKEWLVASGGTVLLSNNGSDDPDANPGDNITDRTDVPPGAAGTGCWILVEFAAGTISDSVHRVLLYIDDASGAIQNVGIRTGPGSTSDNGSTSALPSLTGVWTAANSFNLNPFASSQNIRVNTWRTTTPNRPQRFMVKQQGTGVVNLLWEIVSSTDAQGGGSGSERWAHFISSSGADAITTSLIGNNAFWQGVDAAGSAETSTIGASVIWSISASWTNGLDGSGGAHPVPLVVGQSSAGGRAIGSPVDVYALPTGFPFGLYVDAAEVAAAQNTLRTSFGDLAFYWPNGTTIE